MDGPYEIVSTDPLDIVVVASTPGELVEFATVAMFAATYDIDRVSVHRDVPVMAVGDTLEALLADWIHQVLTLAAAHSLVVTTAAVDRLEAGGMQGAIGGARIDDFSALRPPVVGLRNSPQIVTVPDGMWVRLAFSHPA